MCGIAGIINRIETNESNLDDCIYRMLKALKHRGPDGEGIWRDKYGRVALGHVRLAIVDLTVEGRQPMRSQSGNFVISFNGEIYNYIEIRKKLEESGILFRGTSDTEVLLESIDQWGLKRTLSYIRGMFAIAVWDVRNRNMYLARDRVGKKPLYLYETENFILFSSEIKGIVSVPRAKSEITISPQSISDYLSLGYIIGPNTIYNEIVEIEPGQVVEISTDKVQSANYSYWSYPNHITDSFHTEELKTYIEDKLIESISIRLRSDVPVGVFLSGGIDSGLITAIAAQSSREKINTFTVSFDDAQFDESKLAREISARYVTNHYEFRLKSNLSDLLDDVVHAYDEPFADPSSLPTYAISREASKYVKVVLNGEGSDELFGGYRRTNAMKLLQNIYYFMKYIPNNVLKNILEKLPHPKRIRSRYSFIIRFLRAVQSDPYVRYLLWSSDGFDCQSKLRLQCAARNHTVEPTDQVIKKRFSEYSNLPPLAEFMTIDFLLGMADCLLPKIDIATMANGLEGRSPFLDQEIVSTVATINKNMLLSGQGSKPLLRSIAKKYLPNHITNAPKRGFEIPLVRWMSSDLYSMVREVCLSRSSILFDLFERTEVVKTVEKNSNLDSERWAKRLWLLFMLAKWGESRA